MSAFGTKQTLVNICYQSKMEKTIETLKWAKYLILSKQILDSGIKNGLNLYLPSIIF